MTTYGVFLACCLVGGIAWSDLCNRQEWGWGIRLLGLVVLSGVVLVVDGLLK